MPRLAPRPAPSWFDRFTHYAAGSLGSVLALRGHWLDLATGLAVAICCTALAYVVTPRPEED